MLDVSTLTDLQLRAEIARVDDECARIVADVRGVIPFALADKRERLLAEIDARTDALLDHIFGD